MPLSPLDVAVESEVLICLMLSTVLALCELNSSTFSPLLLPPNVPLRCSYC
ncbi:MAG: hypothetical protein ACK55Z_14125 [bacterium]